MIKKFFWVHRFYLYKTQLVEMTDWLGTTSFSLDLLGKVLSVNDHNNQTVGYGYDAVKLRYIRNNWNRLSNGVKFYSNGI